MWSLFIVVALSAPKADWPPEHEEYDMPPARAYEHPTSEGMISTHGPFTSIQVNVNAQGQNIVGDAANEPSLCIDPNNHNRMAVGWRQFNSVSSNFRQAGWAFTANGGQSWTFPGVLENNVFRSDPVLAADRQGNFYYLSLLQSFFDDLWKSTNGGQTWVRLGPATGGDKQWFVIDNTNSVGAGNMYQAWSTAGNNYGGRQFSRSTNGGSVWMDPINLPNQPIWGTLDVDAGGNLFICGTTGAFDFWSVRSSNAKIAAEAPVFDMVTQVNLNGQIVFGDTAGPNPGGLLGQTWIGIDRSGGPTNGYMYMLCSVNPAGANGTVVSFARSTNGGASWSSPRNINTDTNPNAYHWFGTLAVAPNGRIDVIWYDTRADSNNILSALYYASSNDGGVTWTPNTQISQQFNPTIGWPQQNKIGDYIALVSDNTGGDVIYSATFNNEQDVYYVRIPAPLAVFGPSSYAFVTGSQLSGNLAAVQASDNVRLVGRPGPVASSNIDPLSISFTGTSQTTSPTAFTVVVESQASAPVIRQRIYMFNFATNAYEQVDESTLATTDGTRTVNLTGSLDRFVDQSTRQVRALVSCKAMSPTATYPWTVGIDLVQFRITR